MKKHLKKIAATMLAFLTIVSILTTAVPTNGVGFGVQADAASQNGGGNYAGLSNQDLTVRSTGSFGNLLTGTLEGELEEQQTGECVILSAEVEGTTAVVEFQTLISATIVVGIYDESGQQLIASGYKDVSADDTEAEIVIDTDAMPQYFYVKVFCVDIDSMRPLCPVFESPLYTQEMQELLAMETTDFEADRVLNLDEQTETNFAVYSEETIVIPQSENNDVTYADDESGVYIIENADSNITSLVSGDIFAYEYEDGSVIIVKVASITMDGTTATITGEETSLEEVFDYVKIEADAGTKDAVVDNSNLEEGVVYNGIVQEESDGRMQAVDITETSTESMEYEFLEKKIGSDDDSDSIVQASVTLSGTVNLEFTKSLKVYVSMSSQYVELKLDYSLKAEISITGKVSVNIPLGYVKFNFPGGYLAFTPSFVAEVSGEIAISGGLTGTLGVKVTGDGIENLTTSPKLEVEVKAEVTIFIGISLKPKLVVITEKAVDLSITAELGGEATAEMTGSISTDTSERHECSKCIDGEIYFKAYLEFKARLLDWDKLTFKKDFTRKVKICDFYWSLDFDEFKFTKCPHVTYRTTIIVKDEDGSPLENVVVTVDGNDYTTDKSGKIELYLGDGLHALDFTAEGNTISKQFSINGKPLKLIIKNGPDGPTVDAPTVVVDNSTRLSLGSTHSGYIADDGSLYMWGYNGNGRLGDGTTTDRYTPVKIMDNVASVSLGSYHSGAITTDGSLYMWGENEYGRLGDGTTTNRKTPVNIMNNVSVVSLGRNNSAAITADGSLYTWGASGYGLLGDGTGTNRYTPKKILDNVSVVSLGDYHSAAITTDGLLYMWGWNICGELGTGTTTEYHIPVKIMDNVSAVSLGSFYSAAITTDGSLYMWGANNAGQLGDGTTTYRKTPVKIMDNVSVVSVGGGHSGAITTDGSLYMWGDNSAGELGDGTTTDRHTPVKILDNVSAVSLGGDYSAAVTTDGLLYTWGRNSSGQLGDGTTTDRLTPTKITIPTVSSLNTALLTGSVVNTTQTTLSTGTAAFTDLAPNEIYNFYVMTSKDAETPFSSENLLYISQGISNEMGELSFEYTPKADDTDAEKFVVRMKQFDISKAEITLENLTYTGEEQFVAPVVTIDGETLVEGVDYDLCDDYSATDCGKYTVTVRGKGIYHGDISAEYYVLGAVEAPTNLYAYTFGYTSIKMTWNAVEGADGYEIFRCDRAGQPYYYIDEVGADETAYRNIGLSTGTTYYYKVRAFANLDDGTKLYSDFSAYSSARPLPATPVVTATRTSATTATISWVKIYGATGYSVYRSTEENGTYTFVANLKSGDTTTYEATGLASTKTYYYKVRAYRQMGSDMMFGSYSKPAAAFGAPATPVITARSVGYTSAKVVWEPVENADGYAIYRCDVGGGSYSYVASVGADVTSYTNTGLSTGTTYYYKVRAYMNVGSGKLYSNYSLCATARPIPATPVVTVTADSATTATVSWVRIYGATGYSVYRSTEKDGTYTFLAGISSGDTVTYTDKNLDEGVTYYYKVRAYRQMGSDMMFSNYSLSVCAKQD